MLAVGEGSGPCLCVRKPEPPLQPSNSWTPVAGPVERSATVQRDAISSCSRSMGQPADALTPALRISSHRFDVTDSAPWLVAESDQARVAVTHQHVHTVEGVVGVIVVETIAERSVPQPAQVRAGRCVKLGYSQARRHPQPATQLRGYPVALSSMRVRQGEQT